jgi:hypothetical protein
LKNSLNPSLTKEGRIRKYFPSCVQEGMRGELALGVLEGGSFLFAV